MGPEMATKKLMYIKLPMYLFWYIALGLNDYEGANPLLGPLTFLGSNGARSAHCHFRDQKSLDFQGPNLPVGLVHCKEKIPKT